MSAPAPPPDIRVDHWLDVACLFRTRAEAQKALRTGKVSVNGQVSKPHRLLRLADRIEIARPFGHRQTVIVRGMVERHIARAEARALYEDLTPPPSQEELDLRRAARAYRAAVTPPTTPDKRDRRARRRMKETGG